MKLKKYFFTALAVCLVSLALFLTAIFLRYHSWSTDPRPAAKLASYFSRMTKSDFQYTALEWRLLPFPSVRFSDPVFKFKSTLHHQLKARSLELRLDLLKLIFGDFGFSGLHLSHGEWRGQVEAPKGVHNFLVENIDLKTSALVADRPVKLYMSGDSGGRRKAVVIHGELKLPPLEEPRIDSMGFEVQVLTRNFRFEDSPEWEFLGWIPRSGVSDFLIELKHEPLSDRINFSGDAGLRELVFRSADKPSEAAYKAGNLQVKFAGYFSPATDELKFTQCAAALPFAHFNLQGVYLPHRREFRSMTFNLANVKVDDLPSYFPNFKNKIPFFIGFSGLADLSLSLDGFSNHLKIYGDFDLTHTLFTYGRFFQKPKEKPFRLKTDFDWAAEQLSGEFSGSFEGLTFKGNLPEWRPSGAIKVNFLTNSFAAEKLVGYVPFLSNYELGGNMKLFASFEGKMQGLEPFQKMFHLNMKDGRILRKGTGSGFKDLDLDLDYSPMLMEAKAARFSLGGSFFEAVLRGFHPEKNPKWEGHINSEKWIAANVWKEWKDFWGGENTAWLESLHPWVRKMILSVDPFESLKMEFSSENKNLNIRSLELRAFDGSVTGSAATKATGTVQLQMAGRGMDAERLFKFLGATQPAVDGRANWKADLNSVPAGNAADWSGPLYLSVENGHLNHFGYIQALEQIDSVKKAAVETNDRLAFKSLNVDGRIENGSFQAEKVNLRGDEVEMDGEGEINGAGRLNLRLKTRLQAAYFRELFPKRAGYFLSTSDAFFGPVALLASGPLDALEVTPDPQSVAELAGRYAKKKTAAISKYL